MFVTYQGASPKISDSAFLIGEPYLSGTIDIRAFASIWPGVVARADLNRIVIDEYTNVQDNSVLHVDHDKPLLIGKYVTIGHSAVVHGCSIGNNVLIGIGAIILSGAEVPDNVIVGAGSVVLENKVLESGKLYVGSPARAARDLTPEEIEGIKHHAISYVKTAQEYTQYAKA